MNKPKYLIRLDDACPTMRVRMWDKFEKLFDEFNIKPIMAVIPNNKNTDLMIDNHDPNFWNKVERWIRKGYEIALHGYDHIYLTNESGIIGLNNRSEFAGIPIELQCRKIREGVKIFRDHGIEPRTWVAPAHSFDSATLKALKLESEINIISDGLRLTAHKKNGFIWIPQQLWYPEVKHKYLWTICCHPNTTSEERFTVIENFIKKEYQNFISVDLVDGNYPTWHLPSIIFKVVYKMKKKYGRIINLLKS